MARVLDDTTLLCPAKINAVLSVGEPGSDGYHPVESVMLPLLPCEEKPETLTLQPKSSERSEIELRILGNEALSYSTYDHNLVVKAYNAFYQKFSLEPISLRALLAKVWPTQGGLGGGSSNAAAMLRYLAQQHTLSLSDKTLHTVAASLGADVAFFLQAQPALASGRGEVLSPIAVHESLPSVQWLLVKPNALGISTPWAYQALDEQRALGYLPQPSLPLNQRSLALKTFLEQLPEACPSWYNAFAGLLHNDFQSLAWQQFPEYAAIEEKLQSLGCLATVLCGSGATVAGLLPPGLEWTMERQATLEHLFSPSDYWTYRATTGWGGFVTKSCQTAVNSL